MAYHMDDSESAKTLAAIDECRRADGSINYTHLAAKLGLTRSAVQGRCATLAKRGLISPLTPALPGFEIGGVNTAFDKNGDVIRRSIHQRHERSAYQMPSGLQVKSVSSLVTGDGRLIQEWVKTEKEKLDPVAAAKELEAAFADFKPAAIPVPVPDARFSDQLTLYPWADPHFGSYIWRGDAERDWDLSIAVDTFLHTFAKVISRSPMSRRAILLVGGDTLHADNNTNATPKSGNNLQVDGRHSKVFITACQTIATVAEMLLTNHETIEIVVLQGNHDETSANPIAFFLHAWFRNEPRVEVDVSAHLFRFRQFGDVMLAFTHGHTIKMHEMPTIMASYAPKMWGDTAFRFAHTFHIHHKNVWVSERGAATTESHQVLVPADAWHYGAGYKSERSQQSVTYDRDRGETGRAREALR